MKSESPEGGLAPGLMGLLRNSTPYTSWSDESVIEICALGQLVAYRKGDVISGSRGKPALLYFVETGVFQSQVTIASGRVLTTGYLHPGALLGLAHAFAVLPLSEVHEFVADTDALVWQVSADKFKDLMWRHRPIGESVVTILATRAGNLLDGYANSVLLSAEARVARCLLQSTKAPKFDAMWINFTFSDHNQSQAQLARILGLSRQCVGTILRAFENGGFIKMGRQRIEILSHDNLQKIVGGTFTSEAVE